MNIYFLHPLKHLFLFEVHREQRTIYSIKKFETPRFTINFHAPDLLPAPFKETFYIQLLCAVLYSM
jgi:hypothetical protein